MLRRKVEEVLHIAEKPRAPVELGVYFCVLPENRTFSATGNERAASESEIAHCRIRRPRNFLVAVPPV
jgi:hypothetical protein